MNILEKIKDAVLLLRGMNGNRAFHKKADLCVSCSQQGGCGVTNEAPGEQTCVGCRRIFPCGEGLFIEAGFVCTECLYEGVEVENKMDHEPYEGAPLHEKCHGCFAKSHCMFNHKGAICTIPDKYHSLRELYSVNDPATKEDLRPPMGDESVCDLIENQVCLWGDTPAISVHFLV